VSEIHIALADAPLHDLVAALQAACSEESWGQDFVSRLLATPGAAALLASDASAQPVGYVLVRAGGGEAEVLSLGVLAAARRRGIGRRLMAAAAAQAVLLGAESLFLEVALDNDAALALYQGLGFRAVGLRSGYYQRADGAVDAKILRLQLSGCLPQV
jgi:ribosomal-protein-alanine N-acetyltransferase